MTRFLVRARDLPRLAPTDQRRVDVKDDGRHVGPRHHIVEGLRLEGRAGDVANRFISGDDA